jgi:hypothetical protein
MTTSFDSAAFLELASDGVYAGWSKTGSVVFKKIPGGDDTVIQKTGTGLPRLTMQALMTAAQLSAMYGKVGSSATLIFSYETCTARLEKIDGAQSIGIDNDIYTANLSFIRTGSVSTTPAAARVTEAGVVRVTEAGVIRIVE